MNPFIQIKSCGRPAKTVGKRKFFHERRTCVFAHGAVVTCTFPHLGMCAAAAIRRFSFDERNSLANAQNCSERHSISMTGQDIGEIVRLLDV